MSRLAGLSTRQLRHYQREGLLPVPVEPIGFEPWMVNLARRVAFLIELGFTTAEIREVIGRIAEHPNDLGLPPAVDGGAHLAYLARIDLAVRELRERRAELIELLLGEAA